MRDDLRTIAEETLRLAEAATERPWVAIDAEVENEATHITRAHVLMSMQLSPSADSIAEIGRDTWHYGSRSRDMPTEQDAANAAHIVHAANHAEELARAVLTVDRLLSALRTATNWELIHGIGAWKAGIPKPETWAIEGDQATVIYDALSNLPAAPRARDGEG